MKKALLSLLALGTMLFSCTSPADETAKPIKKTMKPSEVLIYSGGNQLNSTSRAIDWRSEIGYSIPDNGRYLVYYFIRIDGNIPGENEVNLPAKEYFPRTSANKTMISDANHGYVVANANWNSCSKFSKYVYSTDGSAVKSLIVEEPSLEDLVAADQGNYLGKKDDFSGYLAKKDSLHFIWYICKQQNPKTDHTWHIDGILTSIDKKDISETDYGKEIIENYGKDGLKKDSGDVKRKAHVEVDIHQQEHKDWNEIKTSIHLRDTVDVEVFLPIDYQEQADDFKIRVGEDIEYITEIKNTKININGRTFEFEVSIKHEPSGIRINVKPNKEALIAARETYGDGITFEVHSYVNPGIEVKTIWDKLKDSTCDVSPYTYLFGQITSAYFEEELIEIRNN